jgi:hypothetical protein
VIRRFAEQKWLEPVLPTFAEAFVAELEHSGALERMRPWAEAHLIPWIDWCTVVSQQMCVGMFSMAAAIAERAEERYPSKGYAPYFEARGFAPLLARGAGSLIISIGTRQADEAKRLAPVDEAIRFLARSRGQRRAIESQAKLVLAANDHTSIVSRLFSDAGVDKGEFVRLLQTVIDGGKIDRERIKTIATSIASSRPPSRGRKIGPASAAHEQFLESNAQLGLPVGYTWSDYTGAKGDFIDPETQATRLEFTQPRFSPQPARRRLKRRGWKPTNLVDASIGDIPAFGFIEPNDLNSYLILFRGSSPIMALIDSDQRRRWWISNPPDF